jgi:allophanate hydrolase subunit 2
MAKHVIALLGQPILNEDGAAKAGEAILPGMAVNIDSAGAVIKHATAAGAVARFALERDEMGKGIDVAYADGDYVKVGQFAPGMRVYTLIASGQNITAGGRLESAGNGTLRALAAGVAVAMATESVNNAAGPGNARITAELL